METWHIYDWQTVEIMLEIQAATFGKAVEQAARQRLGLHLAQLKEADLRRLDLSHALLREAELTRADLRYADLSGADLSGANLSNADLRYADLSRANLRDANLSNADLRCADLSGAYFGTRIRVLEDTDFRGADLTGTDLLE